MRYRGTGSAISSSLTHLSARGISPSSPASSRLTVRRLRSSSRTAAFGLSGGIGTSSYASRDRKLVDRIKDTVLHSINEMTTRKRKASSGVIDLTRPTQKRPRSASDDDIIVVDDPTEASRSMTADGDSQSGPPSSIRLEDKQSLMKGEVPKHLLNWSRLSMKHIRLVSRIS